MQLLNKLIDDPVELLKQELEKARQERDSNETQSRNKLRDFATQLREPAENNALGPASTSSPSFKLTEASTFPHVTERLPTQPGSGHLSPDAERNFLTHMSEAARHPDAASRDAHASKAAKTVAKDWDQKHNPKAKTNEPSLLTAARQEARAQAVFVAREIGEKIGLNPAESTVIGYALERALEKEGFKVMASYAVDKISDAYKATSASISNAVGNRAAMETSLNKSLNWLAERGVSKEAVKDALKKHSGKFIVLSELASNPEMLQRAAQVIAKSDGAVNAIVGMAKDDDLRKAVGTLTLASGEAVASVHKGVGSVAVLAGSALRGDAPEDTARHVFRAAMSILGGAAGGIAAGSVSAGFGSVAGAVAGSAAGSALADKLLEVYDKNFGGPQTAQERTVSKEELADSSKLIGDRIKDSAKGELNDKVSAISREYSMGAMR